jgi:hypothetical protein
VWADFNGDGFGDLAVGIPNRTVPDNLGEDVFGNPQCQTGPVADAGEVQVAFGGGSGLNTLRGPAPQILREGTCGPESVGHRFPHDTNANDHFGAVLAAGNIRASVGAVSGVIAADLVVGVPFDGVTTDPNFPVEVGFGSVYLVPGSPDRLKPALSQVLDQDVAANDTGEHDDHFGWAVATGDFNNDNHDDVVVGVPGEDLNNETAVDAGAVQIFFAAAGGAQLVDLHDVFISQGPLPGVAIEAGDRFGWSLAVGKFDFGTTDDLAIGSPGEDIGTIADAGLVSVLYGPISGGSFSRVEHWDQDSPGVPDGDEPGDQFGYSLSAWDYGHATESDLAVGVPFEDLQSGATKTSPGTTIVDAGAVDVIYGSFTGLSGTVFAAQLWDQDRTDIQGVAQNGDHFGLTVY